MPLTIATRNSLTTCCKVARVQGCMFNNTLLLTSRSTNPAAAGVLDCSMIQVQRSRTLKAAAGHWTRNMDHATCNRWW